MNPTILVITGDAAWTRRAIHLAAAMARDAAGELRIIHLLPVARLEDLGANAREELLPFDRYQALADWAATAESYGVAVHVELFEYSDYAGALLCAAEQTGPRAIFAPPPGGRPAFVARLREKWLRRRLGRPYFTLGPDDSPTAWSETPAETRPVATAAHEVRI